MAQAQCRHCGHYIDDDVTSCPYCATDNPVTADRARLEGLKRFRWFYVLLFIFCLWMIIYLPRALFPG